MDLLLDNNLLNLTFNHLFDDYSKEKLITQFDTFYSLNTTTQPLSTQLWIISLFAASLVGMVGLIPLLFIPFTMECISSEKNESSKRLRLMLSFAVGGLLGDVFLHLLPEAWTLFTKDQNFKDDKTYSVLGYFVLFGMATFILIQMIFTMNDVDEHHTTSKKEATKNEMNKNVIVAYLNLIANGIDNFSHGLAVGASFVISYKIGILTTIAIIFHEVPHEFADFAILMKSGITKWNAIKAQFLTASIGIFGTIFSLICECYKIDGEHSITTYILPFTAGGFLHIALTSILPELVKENDAIESIKQLICIMLGVFIMGTVNCLSA